MTLKLDKLNEQTLRHLTLPDTGELTYTITCTKGLTIRVRAGGSKTFYSRLWNPKSQRLVRKKLGVWPDLSCSLAVKALEKVKRDYEEAKWTDRPKALTLAQAYTKYRDKKAKEGKSKSFQQSIEQAWRCVPSDLRNTLLDDVAPYALSELVSDVAIERRGTAFHVRRMLKAVYRLALINELCVKDRTLTIDPITLKPKRLLVSNDQIKLVLDTARQHRDKHKVCALLLCAATAQRGSEIMQLHWEDIQDDRIVFRAETRKQREEHVVWINDLVREALTYIPRGTGPMFPMWHRDWISNFGKCCGIKAKVKGFGTHQLRKAAISNLLSQGTPVHIVQQISGHKDTSILMRHYAIATEQQTKEAAQAVSFNKDTNS